MGKYKNLVFGSLLSAISFFIGIASYHSIGNPRPQLAINVIGPPTLNIGDTPEYNVQVQNLSWWAQKPLFQWDVSESTLGEINTVQAADGGIIFGVPSTASQYHIIVAGSVYYNYFVWGYQAPLGITPLDVSVNNPAPSPNPSPTPTPTPDPNFPDDKFQVAQLSYKLFSKVNYAQRADLAKAVAGNYTAVSAAIRAGAITTLSDTFKIVKQKNTDTLTSMKLASSVLADWSAAVQKKLEDDYSAKQLTKLGDFADFFDGIAKGLSYVK
jgi:hypothetical protein